MGWLNTSNGRKCGCGCLGSGSPDDGTMKWKGGILDGSVGCNLCGARTASPKWPCFALQK